MILEWRDHKKYVKTSNEKEDYIINDKVENGDIGDNENSKYDEKTKESEEVDIEDYFHIEFVDGEPVFACNFCYEWSHWTVQPPPWKLVEGGTVCLYELTY